MKMSLLRTKKKGNYYRDKAEERKKEKKHNVNTNEMEGIVEREVIINKAKRKMITVYTIRT